VTTVDRRSAIRLLSGGLAASALAACGTERAGPTVSTTSSEEEATTSAAPTTAAVAVSTTVPNDVASVAARFAGQVPTQWGTDVTGVETSLSTGDRRMIALTFDACGGPHGTGVDTGLIDLLTREQLPATLFLNGRWIDANPQVTADLIANPLFEIANHGTHHRPLSVTGRSAYGIPGCGSAQEVAEEVESNHERLAALVGRPPRFFRSGTAHYDEVAAAITTALGEFPVSFAVNGDAGATFSVANIVRAVSSPPPGAIVLMHMNHPEGSTGKGLAAALPALRAGGWQFVRLSGPA
jgi:peptidoglycan/xylan/chitin deacetylase (PgdA/CDA1 family)